MKNTIFQHILPQRPLATSHSTNWSSISLEHHIQPPGETPKYSLDHYTITILLSENVFAERFVSGAYKHGTMNTGTISIMPAYQSLQWHWTNQIDALLLHLPMKVLVQNSNELLDTKTVYIEPHFSFEDPLICQLGWALKNELEINHNSDQLFGDSMANALAVHLLKKYPDQRQKIEKKAGELSQAKLTLIIDYIHDNLDGEISLGELAALAQLSQYHFSRKFKQSMGLSPYQYVIQQRVERAKQLLRQGKMSISDIAHTCGFAHPSHLHRHFKRLVHVTPGAFINA